MERRNVLSMHLWNFTPHYGKWNSNFFFFAPKSTHVTRLWTELNSWSSCFVRRSSWVISHLRPNWSLSIAVWDPRLQVQKDCVGKMVTRKRFNCILTRITVLTKATQSRAPAPRCLLCLHYLLIDHHCSVWGLLVGRWLLSDYRGLKAGVLTGYVPWWRVRLICWLRWGIWMLRKLLWGEEVIRWRLPWAGVIHRRHGYHFRIHVFCKEGQGDDDSNEV